VEQREELHQGVVRVETDGRLVGAVTRLVAGEAVPRAHRVVQVQHRVGGHPRVVAQLEPVALAHRERTVFVEHGVQAGRAGAALQPQHDGRVFGARHGREEPEEHVGTVRLVHGQVTGVAFDGRLQGFHFGLESRLVDPARLYQGR